MKQRLVFEERSVTCMSCVTERSNIHRPSLEHVTPAISSQDAAVWSGTQRESKHGTRKAHCRTSSRRFSSADESVAIKGEGNDRKM
jgi:hypothetical protein